MFVGKISNETKEKIKSCGVTIYDIPDEYLTENYRITSFRHHLYDVFLSRNKDEYNMVFATDTRDTIFQKDIFKFYENYTKPFLGISLEDDIIRSSLFNVQWVNTYCRDGNILNETIICSGTIIGTIDLFIEFCHTFWEFLIEKYNGRKNPRDQGAMNCLIYYKKFRKDYIIAKDNHGPIMTICLAKIEKLFFDENDNLLNYNGQIAAVVHQYDRKPSIYRRLKKKYDGFNIIKFY